MRGPYAELRKFKLTRWSQTAHLEQPYRSCPSIVRRSNLCAPCSHGRPAMRMRHQQSARVSVRHAASRCGALSHNLEDVSTQPDAVESPQSTLDSLLAGIANFGRLGGQACRRLDVEADGGHEALCFEYAAHLLLIGVGRQAMDENPHSSWSLDRPRRRCRQRPLERLECRRGRLGRGWRWQACWRARRLHAAA